MNRTRRLAIVVALVVAGCSGDDDGTAPSTSDTAFTSTVASAPPTVATTTPTTSLPETTTNPSTSTQPPTTSQTTTSTEPTTSGTNWRAIVQTLGRRRDDLYARPDVSRIREVCVDQSQCFDQLNTQVGDLANKGWRVVGADPYVVLDARVERFDGETLEDSFLVTVVAVVERPENAGRIVDSSGETVAEVEADSEPGFNSQGRVILARAGPRNDPWRLVSQERLREVPA
jgi:hypothetical protein